MHQSHLQAGHAEQHQTQHGTFGEHHVQHGGRELPAITRHVVPGQQQTDRQHGQQEVLSEAERIQNLPQPDVGPVAHGLRAQEHHAALVEGQERQDKRQARPTVGAIVRSIRPRPGARGTGSSFAWSTCGKSGAPGGYASMPTRRAIMFFFGRVLAAA